MTEEDIHPVDVHVGQKVRQLRKLKGMSQDALAGAIGVSFQQVQKYERGANRISMSRLWLIATSCEVPLTFFFEGLNGSPTEIARDRSTRDFLNSDIGIKLCNAAMNVPGPVLLGIVRTLEAIPQAYARPRRAA